MGGGDVEAFIKKGAKRLPSLERVGRHEEAIKAIRPGLIPERHADKRCPVTTCDSRVQPARGAGSTAKRSTNAWKSRFLWA